MPSGASGVVTVTVQPCIPHLQEETIYARQGPVVFIHARVVGGVPYRFSLPVGQYIFSAGRLLADTRPVVVRAGSSFHMNFPPYACH